MLAIPAGDFVVNYGAACDFVDVGPNVGGAYRVSSDLFTAVLKVVGIVLIRCSDSRVHRFIQCARGRIIL